MNQIYWRAIPGMFKTLSHQLLQKKKKKKKKAGIIPGLLSAISPSFGPEVHCNSPTCRNLELVISQGCQSVPLKKPETDGGKPKKHVNLNNKKPEFRQKPENWHPC